MSFQVKHIRGILFDEDKSTAQKRRGKLPTVQQFTIPTITGTAISSGSEATYTHIPNSDDEEDIVDAGVIAPPPNDPKPSVSGPSRPTSISPTATVSQPSVQTASIPTQNVFKPIAIEKSIPKPIVSELPSIPKLVVPKLLISKPTAQEPKVSESSVPKSSVAESSVLMKSTAGPSSKKSKKRRSQSQSDTDQPAKRRASIGKQKSTPEYIEPPVVETVMEEPVAIPPVAIVKQEACEPPKIPRVGSFMCGFCEFNIDTISAMKSHYKSKHPKESFIELVARKINDKVIPVAPQNDHKFVFTCKHCSLRSDSIDELYEHWQQSHKYVKQPVMAISSPKKLATSKKFVFSLDYNVRCAFCNYRISYRQMRSHYQRLHPEGPCASNHPKHRQKCGICGFKGDQDVLFQHFSECHPLQSSDEAMTILDRQIVPINQQMLECLQLNGHRGCHKCLHCGDVKFDFIEDYEEHHMAKHDGQSKLFEVFPAPMLYGCTICDFEAPTELEVVQHLQHHNLYKFQAKFQCLICPSLFKTKIDLRRHHTEDHLSDKRGWRLTPIASRMAVYNRIKVLFPNGLYVCKAELAETEYGSMTAIIDELRHLEEEELLNEVNPMRAQKRKHEEIETVTKVAGPKSRTMKSTTPSVPQAASAYPPEFSFYGRPREKVDLKKIYTTMVFGNNDMKISCDRFAMLVNIDPKLILKRVKLPDYL